MTQFFQFEADFVDSLRCIPMQVRLKLDTCGIKLKLSDWNHMTSEQRASLVELPCSQEREILAYREHLVQLIEQLTGTPPKELPIEPTPAWLNDSLPSDLQAKAQEVGVILTSQQWTALSPLERFALIKLCRPGHENKNFIPALQEFNLFSDAV